MTALVLYQGTSLEVLTEIDGRDIDPEILERTLAALTGQEQAIRGDLDEMLHDLDKGCTDLQQRIGELHAQLAVLQDKEYEKKQAAKENPEGECDDEELPEEFTKSERKKVSKEAARLFKKIAKMTHPDSIGDESMVQIFHLAQKRYKENDVAGLKNILDGLMRKSKVMQLVNNVIEELLDRITEKEASIQDLKASDEYELLKVYTRNPREAFNSYRRFKMMQIATLLQEISRLSKVDMLKPTLSIGDKLYEVMGIENVQGEKGIVYCKLKLSEPDAQEVVRAHMLSEGPLNVTVNDLNGETKLNSVLRSFDFTECYVVLFLTIGE